MKMKTLLLINCLIITIFIIVINPLIVGQFDGWKQQKDQQQQQNENNLVDSTSIITIVDNPNHNKNCSFHEEDDVYCDCNFEQDYYKCYNIESSDDIRFALNHLLNVTNKYYWSLLEISCIEPFSTSVKSFHIIAEMFINGPKFKYLRFYGDCSKPKHYDNLIHVDKDTESIFISKNALRMTTTCSLFQSKLERLFELVLIDSLFAGDMISATFSTRCLGHYGTRNEALPLTKLIIKSCNITLIESGAFLNFAELQLIDFSYNQLSHLSRQVFAPKMYKVRFINLQNNRLSELSSDFFEGLPQLRSVNLIGNLLTTLPFIPTIGVPQSIFLEGNLWDCRCKMDWIILEKLSDGSQRFYDKPKCFLPENVKNYSLMDGLRFVHETFC